MADQKKKGNGGGQGQDPPDDLAALKPAADLGPDPQDPQGKDEPPRPVGVCIEGTRGPLPVKVVKKVKVKVEPTGPVKVSLQRSTVGATADQALWVAIRGRVNSIGFADYERFINNVLFRQQDVPESIQGRFEHNHQFSFGVDAYQLLKATTEIFLILNAGVLGTPGNLLNKNSFNRAQEEARLGRKLKFGTLQEALQGYVGMNSLPYIDRVLGSLDEEEEEEPDTGGAPQGGVMPASAVPPLGPTLLDAGPHYPLLLELLWSYWHEEGMLVQAINAISLRFQNKRLPGENNPLANLELSPLRPLSNLLWGYIQDEPFRLTVARRAYEYSHEYGLSLMGRAVPGMRPADHRSKFLEAFHSLLHQVAVFYKEDSDTTVIANGFPLLNSLKEVHMLLAEGAHNQFGDLPWTARVEMLIQQWLLSRQELRDFLRGRPMVPYKEPWMGQVDTLRRMLGWGDTPVTHFRDLATFGEQILLSIRYGDWINVDDEDAAKNWARYWKPEIQGYVHAYRAATGVDLTAADMNRQISTTSPAVLLQRRLAQNRVR